MPEDIPTAGRPVRESKSEYSELAMPNDANPLGSLFGGKVMALVDLAGFRVPLKPAIPETDEEKRRFVEARRRREFRLELRKKALEGWRA